MINIERILNRAKLNETNIRIGWYKSNISRCKTKLKDLESIKETSLEFLLIQEIIYLQKCLNNNIVYNSLN